jgi:hypothetical protein
MALLSPACLLSFSSCQENVFWGFQFATNLGFFALTCWKVTMAIESRARERFGKGQGWMSWSSLHQTSLKTEIYKKNKNKSILEQIKCILHMIKKGIRRIRAALMTLFCSHFPYQYPCGHGHFAPIIMKNCVPCVWHSTPNKGTQTPQSISFDFWGYVEFPPSQTWTQNLPSSENIEKNPISLESDVHRQPILLQKLLPVRPPVHTWVSPVQLLCLHLSFGPARHLIKQVSCYAEQ